MHKVKATLQANCKFLALAPMLMVATCTTAQLQVTAQVTCQTAQGVAEVISVTKDGTQVASLKPVAPTAASTVCAIAGDIVAPVAK